MGDYDEVDIKQAEFFINKITNLKLRSEIFLAMGAVLQKKAKQKELEDA